MTKDSEPAAVTNSPMTQLLGVRASARFPRVLATVSIAQRILRILLQLLKSATIEARSSGAGAGFGVLVALVACLVASHTFEAQALGLGSALVSGIVIIGLLGATSTAPWLRAPFGPYAASAVIALGLGAALAFGASAVSPSVASAMADPWRLVWFAVAAAAAAVLLLVRDAIARQYGFRGFALIDTALALGVIALLLVADHGDGWALFVAASAPLPIVAGLAIAAVRPSTNDRKGAAASVKGLLGFDMGAVVILLGSGSMPLLVLNAAGPTAAAVWCLASIIVIFIAVLSRSASLDQLPGRLRFAEGIEAELTTTPADAFVRTFALLVPGVALMLLFAPHIMAAFALEHFPGAASLLRLLALASIPAVTLSLVAALLRSRRRVVLAGAIDAVVPLAVVLLAAPLLDSWGVQGLAAAWLTGYTVAAVGLGVAVAARGPGAPTGWLLALAAAAARLLFAVGVADRVALRTHADPDSLRQLLAGSDEPDAVSWHQLGMLPSGGDVVIEFLGDKVEGAAPVGAYDTPPGTRAFLKRSLTMEGMLALERQRENLERLSKEPRLAGCGIRLPKIIAFCRSADAVWSVERCVPGVDGRTVVRDPLRRDAAVAAACAAIDDVHRRTATVTTVDDSWIDCWVRQPASLLGLVAPTLMSRGAHLASVDAFIGWQRSHWLGRSIPIGYYHGDFSPGNVMYCEGTANLMVSGIIDWDRTGWDGPQGYDACHFVLAAQRNYTGEQIGEIIRELLLSPDPRTHTFGRHAFGSSEDVEAMRGMLGLAWLKLVTGNIEKSQKFTANRLWSAANVDRVLQLF